MDKYDLVAYHLSNLDDLIHYLDNTDDSEWLEDVCRNEDNTQNCIMGHLINWYYGKDYQGELNPVWDIFEEMWATTFMIFDVNDGSNPNYQQSTPKERVIAYLKNLWLGIEKPTWVLLEEHRQAAYARMEQS